MAGSSGVNGVGFGGTPPHFRNEALISRADLRVDVAKEVSQLVEEDENVHLTNQEMYVRGSYFMKRNDGRDRSITGNYERHIEESETLMIGESIREVVNGGVNLQATQESEAMVGGAYVNTITGAYLRIAAWSDFLAWGGWLEVDVARIEISGLMIRSYCAYAHVAGIRLSLVGRLVDDFVTRAENFGVFLDSGSQTVHLGSPGSGQIMEN